MLFAYQIESDRFKVGPELRPCICLWLVQGLLLRHNPACPWSIQCRANHSQSLWQHNKTLHIHGTYCAWLFSSNDPSNDVLLGKVLSSAKRMSSLINSDPIKIYSWNGHRYFWTHISGLLATVGFVSTISFSRAPSPASVRSSCVYPPTAASLRCNGNPRGKLHY